MASRAGLVRANDHIVVVQMLAGAFVVKIVSVDEEGHGIQAIRPKSLVDLMMARPLAPDSVINPNTLKSKDHFGGRGGPRHPGHPAQVAGGPNDGTPLGSRKCNKPKIP